MKKIVLYGGSFNPPHIGHEQVVRRICELMEPDRFLVIPAYIPPHKQLADGSPSYEQRFEMCRLAFSDMPNIEICDIERQLEGVSYTYETVQALKLHADKEDAFYLAMGSDQFLAFRTWYRFQDILKDCSLIVVSRETNDFERLRENTVSMIEEFGASIFILPCEPVVISSTEIRKDPAHSDMINPNVRDYIISNHLYCKD